MRITASQCLFLILAVSSQQVTPIDAWVLKPLTVARAFQQSRPTRPTPSAPSAVLFSTAASTAESTQNDIPQAQSQSQSQSDSAGILRELYPPSTARKNGTLRVDDSHTLYYEVHGGTNESNNTQHLSIRKKSALFLHGGPGAGCNANHARFFNPDLYDTIVLFDQRGCGKSTPRGQVYNNTLMDLVHDCERLRKHLQVDKWDVVLGGSWGSTLAIAYAQEFPAQVKAIVLRGVCLLRRAEVDWLFTPQGGAAQRCPQAWNQFANAIGVTTSESDDDANVNNDGKVQIDRTVLHAYYDKFMGKKATERWKAARGWMTWEFTVSSSYKQMLSEASDHGNSQDSANQTDPFNATPPSSPAVLVSPPYSTEWTYQDAQGATLETSSATAATLDPNPTRYATEQLRKGLLHPVASTTANLPLRPIALKSSDFSDPLIAEENVGNFSGFPAMPMLTCFYSVNDGYAMNHIKLMEPERMERIHDIPCIAIQGGLDPICPPDTALDVNAQWSRMELRIPLHAGHSMYHPELTHELVKATDRLGKAIDDDGESLKL